MTRRSQRRRRPQLPAAAPAGASVLADLEELYAQLPALVCLGLCEHSCAGHVDASDVERARILERGVDLDAPTADGACPALTRAFTGRGSCAVHQVRPMVCRLWGTAAAMPCPHGCRPDGGHTSDAQTMRWLLASLQIGGHRHTDDRSEHRMREVLEQCMHDPDGAALMGRWLRGDRTAATALQARLADVAQ